MRHFKLKRFLILPPVLLTAAILVFANFNFSDAQAIVFEDGFASAPLGSGWSFTDPRGNSANSLAAGHLEISVPAGSEHDCYGATKTCARIIRNISSTD